LQQGRSRDWGQRTLWARGESWLGPCVYERWVEYLRYLYLAGNGKSGVQTDQNGVAVDQLVPEPDYLPTCFLAEVDPIDLYDHTTVKRVKPRLRVQRPLPRVQTTSDTGVVHEEGAGVRSSYCCCPTRWAERAGDPMRRTRTVCGYATRHGEVLRCFQPLIQEGSVTAAEGAQKGYYRSIPPRPVEGRCAGRAPGTLGPGKWRGEADWARRLG